MDTKSDEQFLIIQATIESNKQEADEKQRKNAEKQMNTYEKLTQLIETINNLTEFMMDQNNIPKSSPTQKDTSTPPDPTTMVPTNRRYPPLEGGHYTKICGMWTLRHEISSPKFYELLIRTELKGDTALYLKNFFNHINMCLNAVNRLQ